MFTLIYVSIAKGMLFLHSKNIIHRDLKWANVLLDSNMVAKITDFGVSTLKDQSRSNMTKFVGTGSYMAPEIVLKELYDEKCDVFSFGIMMFELYCEQMNPYGNKINIEAKVAKNPLFRPVFPENMDIPQSRIFFVFLMQRCWSHEPSLRPSFADIVNLLEEKFKAL